MAGPDLSSLAGAAPAAPDPGALAGAETPFTVGDPVTPRETRHTLAAVPKPPDLTELAQPADFTAGPGTPTPTQHVQLGVRPSQPAALDLSNLGPQSVAERLYANAVEHNVNLMSSIEKKYRIGTLAGLAQ